MKNVTCKVCNRVYFSVTPMFIKEWKKQWDEYWPTLDYNGRESFGVMHGPPSINTYLSCDICNNSYKNFRDSTENEFIKLRGRTVNPILGRKYNL